MTTRISSRSRIAIGQVALLVSVLVCAIALGLIPSQRDAIARGRTTLCEAIAVTSSVLAARNDIEGLQASLEGIARRDPQMVSAAVRLADGSIIAVAGKHTIASVADQEFPGDSIAFVPIWSESRPWGRVEVRFRPLAAGGVRGFIGRSDVRLTIFVSLACFLLYQLYLRKMLQHLDPSKVVPSRVRSALDTLAEGLLILDNRERIMLANQSFAALAGKSAEALLGVRATALAWVIDAGNTVFPWQRAIETGEPQRNMPLRLRNAEGVVRSFAVNCSPVMGPDGKHRGVLASFEDVTQLENQKVELAGARDAAEAASRAKSEFLARMSHEIRTPMNAILGFADVLRRGYEQNEAERQEYLETIHASGQHLMELINDLLDLSKIEAGRMSVERTRCSPHETISEVVNVLRVRAKQKQIDLEYSWDGPVAETIETDALRLRQILTNLVGNAIKFTEKGSVRVVARLAGTKQEPKLAIDVIDTGIGIAAEDAPQLFQPFVQADTSITRRFGGTGLGLAISRQLAQALGGDISVKSEPGEGSCFTCTLNTGSLDGVPMVEQMRTAENQTPELDAPVALRLPPLRVLSVEDGESNQKLIALVLKRAGVDAVEFASNGAIGLEMAARSEYDVVLMDMQMPVMDGYTAAAQLRERGFTAPIIALTAHAMKGEELQCIAAGCSAFVPKPIDMELLVRTIAESLGEARPGAGQSRAANAPPPTATSAGAEVAVAAIKSTLPTDDPDFREVVEEFVERMKTQMNELESAWRQRELQRVAALAHWIKGSGGTAGFDAFTAPARRLEHVAKEADLQQIARSIDEIRRLADRISPPDASPAIGTTKLEETE